MALSGRTILLLAGLGEDGKVTGPPDVVREIVRCEDCRWYGHSKGKCLYRPLYAFPVRRDHWCAVGERRRRMP